ncbi:Leucine rich repeat domain protein [Mycena indigotica]|uniref:Leucine rich repeat domain protein n=1 Tax=Mycena indigotica TaxID=2126181 RepID=A0A8H6TBB8_9AGAR|nr:Leucine rich repeat domain protein [Mycena indigotica]KAF7315373.1 Leucine rich repeat domain protein [Mycena indigotica]
MAAEEDGDTYLRRLATFIRGHERNLAASVAPRRRGAPQPTSSIYNPLSWFDSGQPTPEILNIDTHRLFYTLMRLEAIGLNVGTLDVRIDSPSRPMSYISVDKAETTSILSFRSTFSAVSGLSLGAGWWGRPEPPSLDVELKYLYSSFTKLPALVITTPSRPPITDTEPTNENAAPLDVFRNLQSLECVDIDPRALLGWDRLAESLRSLKIKRSGIEDVSDIFVGAVLDDQARRAGSTSRKRRRRIPRGSPASYATRLPGSVPEEEIENASPPPPELSSFKWAFLKHLSLADNGLTFFPSVPCTSLTHLDLSSNLLVSVPPNLGALYNLVSLNLSDNMIDSVLGIYQHLGQVLFINLSHNRLESLCGLERLPALERVDLRSNLVDESAEVGRLATLPNIAEIWIEGNPFVEIEEDYRLACFNYFSKEGKSVSLDGTQPGFYERRNLVAQPSPQMSSSRPVSAAYSPPVVAVGSKPREEVPTTTVPPVAKGRRKNKRIVDLEESDGVSIRSGSHTRTRSDGSARPKGKTVDIGDKHWGQFGALAEDTEEEPAPLRVSTNNTEVGSPPRRSRHTRYQSEMVHMADVPSSPPLGSLNTPTTATFRRSRNSATFSANANKRRSRVTASVYEPLRSTSDGEEEQTEVDDGVEAYRRRIEDLKKDMGDRWLSVFRNS